MKVILTSLVAIAVSNSIYSNASKSNAIIKANDDVACSSPFSFYNGWCVFVTDPKQISYQEALDTCAELGAFAPSLHSKADQDFWIGYAHTPGGSDQHFWLRRTLRGTFLTPSVLSDLVANTLCRAGLIPFTAPNEKGRGIPTGCYLVGEFPTVYDAAADICQRKGGFVAAIHDDAKDFFMLSLFPPKTPFWIGLTRNGTAFEWADGSNDNYRNWAAGNPVAGQDCVYCQQQTGFSSSWFSAPCSDSLQNSLAYACQLRPCSAEYNSNALSISAVQK